MYSLLNIMAGGQGAAPVRPAYKTPFYVEDVSGAANTVSIKKSASYAPTLTIETSTDGGTWNVLGDTSTTALQIAIPANGKVYVRCNAAAWGTAFVYNTISTATSAFNVGGNIMSLLYGSNFENKTAFPNSNGYTFQSLFYGNTRLKDASGVVLPVTTMTSYCYEQMFRGCSQLTVAPATLSATMLAEKCYYMMFRDCTRLVSAPALPAMTLAASCYACMFQRCTALTTAPTLPATTLADHCYDGMFLSCSSLTTAPTLPATTLSTGCYWGMFNGCTSLTAAPALPATTLAQQCYLAMFAGCSSLTTAPTLPATTLTSSCYESMFQWCSSLTTAPALPATTLAPYCYQIMFGGCSSLNSITCLATDISASGCTNRWVESVHYEGTFIKAASMSGWTTGAKGIPSGWTVLDA